MFTISAWDQNYVVRWLKCLWVNLGSIGALMMHRSRCFVTSAMGEFKINGPSTKDKGPMTSKEDQETSNKASQPQPTRAGRIGLCQETIKEARRCLVNGDKQCTMKLIEELVKNQCHDGRLIGREVADEVRDLVHRLWLGSDYVEKHEVMTWLMDLNASKKWKMKAIKVYDPRAFNNYVRRYVTEWDPANSQVIQNTFVRVSNVIAIEELLRREFKWDEWVMCRRLWRFVGVDINAFEKYGIDLCEWLSKLTANTLTDARWLGWFLTDLSLRVWKRYLELNLSTTNGISAIHFLMVLRQIKAPILIITRDGRKAPSLKYRITVPKTAWVWPISKAEAVELLRDLNRADLVKAIAAVVDGDGSVEYHDWTTALSITFGRYDNYEVNVIQELLQQQFGAETSVKRSDGKMDLKCYGDDAMYILSEILPYITHPLKLLRVELILAYHGKRIRHKEFERLYNMTKYEQRDVKRNHALEVVTQATPQTHTHGQNYVIKTP
jgi:hypothetical protein